MQITRAIREYVEENIRNKYMDARDAYGLEYQRERDAIEQEIKAKIKEYEDDLKAFVERRGFGFYSYNRYGYNPNYTPAESILNLCINPVKPTEQTDIDNFRRKMDQGWQTKAKQVLFDLEVGGAKKAELTDILSHITVDVG